MIRVEEVIKMYVEEKKSIDKIATKLKSSFSTVSRILKENEIKIRSNLKIEKSEYPIIIKLFKEEYWSLQMIGDKYGVSRCWIKNILNKNGIDTSKKANGKVMVRCLICNRKIERNRKKFRTNNNNFCCHEHYMQWIQENKTENYNESRQGQRNARKIMEKYYGELPSGSVVHHIDGNCENNKIENLILFPSHSEHLKFHRRKKDKCLILFDGRDEL